MNRQEKLWDLVWWKRIVYFMSIIVFLLIVIFPFCPRYPERLPYEGWLKPLSAAIGGLGSFLPDFLGKWLRSYQSYPGYFLSMAAVFAVILLISSRLQNEIFDRMRLIFDSPLNGGPPAASPTGFVWWLRTNTNIKKVFRVWRENIAPFIVLIIVLMFLARGIFAIIDAAGLTNSFKPGKDMGQGIFDSKNLYWDSHQDAKKGTRYRITLTINDSEQNQWRDKTICTPISGHNTWYLLPFIPIRRHIMEKWSKPFARIGKDEYPLNPAAGSDSNANKLVAEIQALQDGRISLYLNDAVLPVPNSWQYFYSNNEGTAKVIIEPLP